MPCFLFPICTFIADRDYDAKSLYNDIKSLYGGEAVIPLNKRNAKNSKYLPQGNPVCNPGLAMHSGGVFSDRRRTRHKCICPLKNAKDADCPCHHKNFYNGKKHYGCTKYIAIPDGIRLSIDCSSRHFAKTCPLRTECGRYNSRFKRTGRERRWVRDSSSASNPNTTAHVSLLAVAAAALSRQSVQAYRKLKPVRQAT